MEAMPTEEVLVLSLNREQQEVLLALLSEQTLTELLRAELESALR